jgi:hypothetical protein
MSEALKILSNHHRPKCQLHAKDCPLCQALDQIEAELKETKQEMTHWAKMCTEKDKEIARLKKEVRHVDHCDRCEQLQAQLDDVIEQERWEKEGQ